MPESKLEKFFSPESVAVIGASNKRDKIGCSIMKNLIEAKYKGKIFPVNLKSGKILGLKAYPSVSVIEAPVDLAIIVIPAQFVNQTLEECGGKGVKNVIIISAGFKETGKDGAKLEQQLRETAAKFNMQIIGPNCLGLADSVDNLNASFADGMIRKGTIGFISQSGAICSAILDWANLNNVGFSRFVSIGNKAMVSETELMEYFRRDDKTTAVLAYLESIKDGKAFMRSVARLVKVKPLIIIKPGVSKASQKAMQSHTGALAGADEANKVAFFQSGAVRVKDMEELFNVANFLSRYKGLKNNRVAVLTNAGGPGVIATDELEGNGLQMAVLSKKTKDILKASLPGEANINNPVDVLGDARADRFRIGLEALIEDKNVDAIVFLLTPQRGTEIEKTGKVLMDVSKKTTKPIVASFIGGELVEKEASKLKRSHLATYEHLSDAIFALGKIWEYEKNRKQAREYLNQLNIGNGASQSAKLSQNPDFIEALDLLGEYGIPIVKSETACTPEEAVRAADSVGYPVAMKIFSKTISHKTDVGGVKIGISSDLEVREYFDKMKKKLGGDLEGMIVQPMISGREIILGIKRDDNFGPMLMFGLGGIYTEALKDVAFRFAPIDKNEAMEMMRETKAFKTLTGYRDLPKMDVEAVAQALMSLSELAIDHPEIKELDINPLMVQKEGEGCRVLDVRIII